MGLPRSTFDDAPRVNAGDAEIVARMQAIRDEFETCGYRDVGTWHELENQVGGSEKQSRTLIRKRGSFCWAVQLPPE